MPLIRNRGGSGGGNPLRVYARSDNGQPAVFATFAALETYTATQNGTSDAADINVSTASAAMFAFVVGTISNNVLDAESVYIRLSGEWVLAINDLVGLPGSDGMGSLPQDIPANTLILAADDSGTIVPRASAVRQMDNEVQSSMPISSPSAGAYRLGNLDIFNDGIGISVQDFATGLDYIPVAYERSNSGSERPTREIYQGQTTTPPAATSSETFSGQSHQFAVVNTGRGTAQSYTFLVPADAVEVTDCNIVIRYNSHTDPRPAFDYMESTGGVGFTLNAGDGTNETEAVVTLPRAAFFPDGVSIYITITAGDGQSLQLRGQTIDLTSVGLGMEEVPVITVMGQTTVQKELADLDDILLDHPVTLRRDMPSQEDSLALANASLNQNSALWTVANNQLVNSNRDTATILAQISGLPDLNGDPLPTVPTDASTIQLRAGTVVRVFGQDDFRVVTAPVVESDIDTASDEEIRDVIGATLVAGTGVSLDVDDDNDTITINATGGGSTPDPMPRFTRFEFQDQLTSVAPGTTLSGLKTFLIRVDRPDLLTGHLTIRQGSTVLTQNTLAPTVTSAGVPINQVTLSNAGDSIDFTIEGTIATGGTITSHITIRVYQPHEVAYYGIRENNDFSSVLLSSLFTADITVSETFDVTGDWDDQHFIGILVPSTMDITRITTLATPVTSSFTRTENARTIGAESYILYTLQNNGGIDGQAAYTVEV